MEIKGRGIDEAQERLEQIRARLENLQPVMEVAAQDTVTLIDDSFDGQRSPDGTPWQELSEKTIARRRKGRGTGEPRALIDTGRLRQSITGRGSRRGFTFGTNVIYGGVQQFGGGRSRIPARPFLPIVRSGGRFSLMTTGYAGQHWSQVRRAVAHYIRTGEIV